MRKPAPKILDVACGGRMFWFDKKHPSALYLDNRELPVTKLSNRQNFKVKPDMVMDFRKLDLPSKSFYLVVFDPPHLKNTGRDSYMAKKYGRLDRDTWKEDIAQGFNECWRVLKPNGVLIFKWNEYSVSLKELLEVLPERPLFGHKTNTKTHWLCFMKV